MTIPPDTFRSVLGRFASGVTVLTVFDGKRDHGMTVSAFCSASLEPSLVLVCVDKSAEMYAVLAKASHFGISILAEGQEALSRRFAELPAGRFDGIGFARGRTGVALLDDAVAHLECKRLERHDAGDHGVFLGEVESAAAPSGGRPLLYYRGGYAQLEH
jgi:flavin reductase (DIM6/NTAB) family NADH-FMN oxidoreductase RutF